MSNTNLTIELNKKLFTNSGKSLEIDSFKMLKDDIRNYRPLSEYQLLLIEKLTDIQKIEIIKLYNSIMQSIEEIIK